MSSPRTIVITGATGRQGGAVLEALLARSPSSWKVVALTRDPSSTPAKALAARGVALVKADANNRASLDAALAAHAPVYGFFAVTNPFASRWNGGAAPKGDVTLETQQGLNMVDACKVRLYPPLTTKPPRPPPSAPPHTHTQHTRTTNRRRVWSTFSLPQWRQRATAL